MNGSTRRWRNLRRHVLASRAPVCHWCGRRVGPGADLDHLIPLALGGPRFDPANLVVSCARCNRKRGGSLGRERQVARFQAKGRRVWPGAIDL